MSSCSLPEGVWKLILQHIPLEERLCSCALTSKALHRAAIAATYVLSDLRLNFERAQRLWQWLDKHGQHVRKLLVRRSNGFGPDFVVDRLPCQNLRHLELYSFSVQLGPSSSHPGVLQVCTALTKLVLDSGLFHGGHSCLAALSTLSALQHLELHYLLHDQWQPPEDIFSVRRSWFDLPAAVLSCLQQLAYVEVRNTQVCLQHFSCLKRLQQLRLEPTSPVTPNTISGLDQLTALQDLELYNAALDPAALHGCTTLQRLLLDDVGISKGTVNGMQSLLSFIAQQQHLQELELLEFYGYWPAAPSAYTALSASSRLQQLRLSYCNFPSGIWNQGVFKPGQQLPELRKFELHLRDDVPALFSQLDVGALASCCPGLRSVDIPIQPGVQLTALAQLTALEELNIHEVDATSCSSLSALSALRSLNRLDIRGSGSLPVTLLPLTGLQHLRSLRVIWFANELLHIDLKGSNSQPDVWKQLLELHCENSSSSSSSSSSSDEPDGVEA